MTVEPLYIEVQLFHTLTVHLNSTQSTPSAPLRGHSVCSHKSSKCDIIFAFGTLFACLNSDMWPPTDDAGVSLQELFMSDTKDKVKESIDNAADKAKKATETVVDKTKDAAHRVGEKVKEAGQAIKDKTS
jgi:hypothetical protein